MKLNLGEMADAIFAKKAEIAAVTAKADALDAERRAMEERLLNAMKDAGTDIVRGDFSTVSISENVRPQIADFDALTKFILRNKATQLFERRISATAYRELIELRKGKAIPGLTEFTQERLNVRKKA